MVYYNIFRLDSSHTYVDNLVECARLAGAGDLQTPPAAADPMGVDTSDAIAVDDPEGAVGLSCQAKRCASRATPPPGERHRCQVLHDAIP